MSEAERETAVKLAKACRIIYHAGWGQLGHLSARVEGTDIILSQRHYHPEGKGLKDVTPADMMQLHLDGRQMTDPEPMEEYHIHTEIYKRRPDVLAIAACHLKHAAVLSATISGFRPITFHGAVFSGGVPVLDLGAQPFIATESRGAHLARTLNGLMAILIRGKGGVTVGRSIEEACIRIGFLEIASWAQLMAAQVGELREFTQAEMEALMASGMPAQLFFNTWRYYERKLTEEGKMF